MEEAANTKVKKKRNGGYVTDSGDSSSSALGDGVGAGAKITTTTTTTTSSPSSSSLGCPLNKASSGDSRKSLELSNGNGVGAKEETRTLFQDDSKFIRLNSKLSEMDMMKERFAKLLLGEDMSGSGKGVCSALAISNAITNLCATVFGQLWRLEPLPSEKKAMWRREMEWLLSVGDHIVELTPSWQNLPDGSKLEVMTCRPRSDLFINLPALRKLDNMLLEILDSFIEMEFWYVDQGISAPDADGSASFRKTIQRQDDKWWLPVPRVPGGGLSDKSRKQLNHMRECANQILKAAMAINSITLAEMGVPDSYLEALPKNGRACLGDLIYRYITSDQFSSECLLDCLDLSSEHIALEIANRVESSIYVWRRRARVKPATDPNRSVKKSSWDMVKDFMADGDKREILAGRAESLLISLKERFPSLAQTTLDTSKIQFNKDVGKAILESYSRVLESLAFNIVARIDDLLYVDDLSKYSEKLSLIPAASVIAHKKVRIPFSMPVSGPPYKTTFSTPNFSPAPLVSPARAERTPFLNKTNIINNSKPPHHRLGFGVKRVLTNYLGAADSKAKTPGNPTEVSCPNPKTDSMKGNVPQKDSSQQQNGTT